MNLPEPTTPSIQQRITELRASASVHKWQGLRRILMVHDTTCTLDELRKEAVRCPNRSDLAPNLALAAIAFTVQLAIDFGHCDPVKMRALEHTLIAFMAGEADAKE